MFRMAKMLIAVSLFDTSELKSLNWLNRSDSYEERESLYQLVESEIGWSLEVLRYF